MSRIVVLVRGISAAMVVVYGMGISFVDEPLRFAAMIICVNLMIGIGDLLNVKS